MLPITVVVVVGFGMVLSMVAVMAAVVFAMLIVLVMLLVVQLYSLDRAHPTLQVPHACTHTKVHVHLLNSA